MSSDWIIASISAIFGSIVFSIVTAFISSRRETKISEIIMKKVSQDGITLEMLELGKGQLDELRKVIDNESLPVVLTEHPHKKNKYFITLKSSSPTSMEKNNNLLDAKKEVNELRIELRSNLFYASMTGIGAILAFLISIVSFFAIIKPSSIWDFVFATLAPLVLIIEISIFILLYRKKKKTQKDSSIEQ
jgi:hypothetical protein